MKHVIIGTAGHVDHGKTMLIKALTGIDTDRLIEEKKRGITIELGFAHIEFDDHTQAGIIDVPGHEKFIKNMLAGAGGIDLAMLVVAADEGFMPQTVEHLDILTLLGIRDGVVVITKTDMVDEEWVEIVREDIAAHVKGTFLEGKPVLPVSAYTGQGIPELKKELQQRVSRVAVRNEQIPFRLPVDRVFSKDGFGTVVTGTMIEGNLSVGDPVELMPSGQRAKVRTLQVHHHSVEQAYAGQRVAVNLAGLRRDAVVRGDTLCKPDTLRLSRMLDVRLTDLKDSHRIIENGSPVHFYHGAAAHIAKVVLLEQDTLESGQSGFAQLRFTEPVAVKRGDRFVIRFYSPMETIGGGVILDDCPPRHKRHQPEVIRALTIREGGSAGAQLQQLVEEYGYALPTAQTLAQRQSMPEEEMVRALEDLVNSGDLLEILPRRYLAAPLYRKACQSVEQVLAEYHKANPLHAGMKVAALRQKALRGAELKEADAILTAMLRGGTVTAIADRCALPDFRVVLTKRQTALRQKLLDSYRKSGREVPFVDDIYASFPTNERDDCKKVLENLVSCGELVMLTPQLFYHKDVYEEVCALTRDFFEGHPAFTLAEYRDLLGTSRKYALAILEFFDKTKVTKMVGDHREVIGSL